MTTFNPWLSQDTLTALSRQTQVYPLDVPYGLTAGYKPEEGHSLLPYFQVKARPEDPTSPFIWGHAALMMVCGGAWRVGARQVKEDRREYVPEEAMGYVENTVYTVVGTKPQPHISTKKSTQDLIRAMTLAGFTRQETRDCLARHSEAGGAYWLWINSWKTFKEEFWINDGLVNRRTGEVIDPDHTPLRITSFDPWDGPYREEGETTPPAEKPTLPTYENPKTGWKTMIDPRTVALIIDVIEAQTLSTRPQDSPSPWELEDRSRVATVQTLKGSSRFRFMGKRADAYLREGYLPYLTEIGLLIAHHGGIHKHGGGKGRTPDVGYTLAQAPEHKARVLNASSFEDFLETL